MTEAIWEKFLTDQDRAVLAASGYGIVAGFGKRPALIIVDVNYAFCGDKPEPILESIKKWRTSCGEAAWKSVSVIRQLIDAAHKKGIPVIFTTSESRPSKWYSGAWAFKSSRNSEPPPPERPNVEGAQIVHEIEPQPQDIVVKKQKPSAFYGTPLESFLNQLQVDSLIFTGTTTSGCVRASVIDAFSLNYRCALVEDGTFDRFESSHAINLFDLHAKYADIVSSREVVEFIEKYPKGQFTLPS